MTHFPCDVCGRVATVHDTVAGPAGTSSRHYCRDHGLPIWRVALPRQVPNATIPERRADDRRGPRPYPPRDRR